MLHIATIKNLEDAKLKKWFKQARELRDKYTDDKLAKFKVELNKLSNMYYLLIRIIIITMKILNSLRKNVFFVKYSKKCNKKVIKK